MSGGHRTAEVRRVALIHPSRGPVTRELWSGTPAGLVGGLRELGIEAVPLGFRLPVAAHKAVALADRAGGRRADRADHSPVRMRARELSYRRQLARLGRIDAGIAVGTDCFRMDRVAWGFPVASYDDTTFATMWRHPDSDVRLRGFAERDVRQWIETQRLSSRSAQVNCASTAWAARSLVDDFGIDPRQVAVVGMGHVARPERANPRRDWRRPTFLFLGVEWQRKNGDVVLRAFEQLRQRVPEARLHLVGAHPEVHRDGVIDHGYLPRTDPRAQAELDRVFRESTALVLPSLFDPSPISYLEAASAGLPVIATSEGGAGELLGDAAITVRPRRIDEVMAAMLALCDPAEAERRGRVSSAIAATATWRDVAGRIVAALSARPHVRTTT